MTSSPDPTIAALDRARPSKNTPRHVDAGGQTVPVFYGTP